MSKARGLGRGFDSLIPTEVTADMPVAARPASGEAIEKVDISKIKPNPHQPRTNFDADELKGLAESIKEHGILHPPVVQAVGDGYELIAGERRVRAAKLAGLKTLPVIVRSYDEQQKLELALLENVQRSNLNPIETALAYKKLADEFNLSLDELSRKMGRAKSTIANSLRLLQLPAEAANALVAGKISEAHGRAILAVAPERQAELLDQIIKGGWSVRQAEQFARDAKSVQKPAAGASKSQPQINQQLSQRLGVKVVIQPSAKTGGKVVLEYKSDSELARLEQLLAHAAE